MSDKIAEFILGEMKDLHEQYYVFYEMYYERRQLYGCLIKLIENIGETELIFTGDELKLANKYILKFTPEADTKSIKIELVPNPDYKEPDEYVG